MADKLSLINFGSLQNDTSATADLNANNATIISAIDNTLSRDGTSPNQMSAPLDMNSQRIINLPTPTSNFDAVRLLDVTSLGTGGSITVNPLPVGGTTGQVLSKNSSTNFDAGWSAVVTGVSVTPSKTLSVTNSLTLSGTDGTIQTFPAASDTLVGVNSTQTLINKSLNTAAGNILSVNGTPLTNTTGAGAVVLTTTPTITSPTIAGAFTATNLVTNTSLAQMPAASIKGNAANVTSNASDFTINGLANLAAPDAVNDFVIIWDHTNNILKKANPTAISGAAVAGVSSIAGNTGVFLLGPGLTNSGNTLLANVLYHRNYLSGLTLSGGGSQTLTVQPGLSASDDNSTLMSQGATFTKTIGTAWAVGSAAGSLDTGAIANSTWYHVYMIERLDTSVVDYLTSVNATSPTMPTNYTVKRRIGSFKTDGSANITAFVQVGDQFLWNVPVSELNFVTNPGTAAVNRTLAGVPLGIVVEAMTNWVDINGSTNHYQLISPLSVADTTPSATAFSWRVATSSGSTQVGSQYRVLTDTSARIRTRQDASGVSDSLACVTVGWIDTRGK